MRAVDVALARQTHAVRLLVEALTGRVVATRAAYGSKKGLLDACIDEAYVGVEEIATEFASRLPETRSLPDLIREYAAKAYNLSREHRAVLKILIIESVREEALDPARTRFTQTPFLALAADTLARDLGVSKTEVRLRLQTIISAIGHYAVRSERDLGAITGIPDADV